ncbi:MAG: UPF0223 family protein [Lactobacillaceae bacterium]|jgi:uncharacterized protein YktA (UPF0223 family)|nr:UPF0223 family protein [Lactobacillaceae bacterium]
MAADKNFNYPLLDGWDTNDITKVSALYSAVASAYETGIEVQSLLDIYQAFLLVVPSKGEQKQLDRVFQAESGYSIYKTIQAAKATTSRKLTMVN